MPAIAYHDRPPSHLDQARAEIKRLPQHARSYLRGMFPIIDWLPKYNLGWFYGDVICAVTIGTIIIPQSMAYGKEKYSVWDEEKQDSDNFFLLL